MLMDQKETFDWLMKRSRRLTELEQQLARMTEERDEAYEWIKARPEREIAFRHDTQKFDVEVLARLDKEPE